VVCGGIRQPTPFYVIIHEAKRTISFSKGRILKNLWTLILADLPNAFPPEPPGFEFTILKHHAHQGDYEAGCRTCPNRWEARLIGNFVPGQGALGTLLFSNFSRLHRAARGLRAIRMWSRWSWGQSE